MVGPRTNAYLTNSTIALWQRHFTPAGLKYSGSLPELPLDVAADARDLLLRGGLAGQQGVERGAQDRRPVTGMLLPGRLASSCPR